MIPGVHVDHEIDKRSLEARPHAGEQSKAGARDPRGAIQVKDSERRPNINMILRIEIHRGGFPQRRTSRFAVSSVPLGTDS